MWTVFILLFFLDLHLTVATSPPTPLNVSFSSVNLRNVLHWVPGINTPDDTHFTVEYSIYGVSIEDSKGRRVYWRAVQRCSEIVRTWCDLSRETEDEEQGYYARVRAFTKTTSSMWAVTPRRFDPKEDTSFGPPLVSVEIENNSAIVTLMGPMRHLSKNQSSVLSMAAVYPQMTYNLSIKNTYRNQVHHVLVLASPYRYQLSDYNTQYCFSAQSRFLSMPIQCQPSVWHCVTTPQDPLILQLQKVVVGIVVPGLCFGLLAVVGYLLHQYLTGKGQKSPPMLSSPYFQPGPVTFPPDNPSHINVILKTGPISDPIHASEPRSSSGHLWITAPPPAYSPQSPGAHPEDAWDDLTPSYGCVSTAPEVNAEENEGRETSLDGGNAGTRVPGGSCPRNWSGVLGGHSHGVSNPPQKGYLTQNLLQTCGETRMLVDSPAEMNTTDHACSKKNLTLLSQPQVPSLASQRSASQISRKKDEVHPGLFSNKDVEPENKPSTFGYASQNIPNMNTFPSSHSDYLPDDYGFVVGANQETEEDDGDYRSEEEGGKFCIDWDPETRKLVLPTIGKKERVEAFRAPEEDRGDWVRSEDEEGAYVTKGELRLENVFVKQGTEAEAETRRLLESSGATGCEMDGFLSKWNLKIPMGE